MSEQRVPVDSHPLKISVAGFGADGSLRAEDGWVNMNVKWLVTEESVGARSTVFGITVFPPGARHDIHRHPHAEETEYLLEGEGIARVGDDDVAVVAGDIVFVPENDYHGFVNTSPTERAVMVWCYGGAASLDSAGYEREPDPQD
jgi:quercetin dioxygenase-like cupin family protein